MHRKSEPSLPCALPPTPSASLGRGTVGGVAGLRHPGCGPQSPACLLSGFAPSQLRERRTEGPGSGEQRCREGGRGQASWGSRRPQGVPETGPARGTPCPALSAGRPQAAQLPPAEETPTDRAQSRAAPASPLALPEAPGMGGHGGLGPSLLIPPCPPASHHSSPRSGPQALGGIKPQAFAECWRFALLCTALLGGSRTMGHSLGAQRPG